MQLQRAGISPLFEKKYGVQLFSLQVPEIDHTGPRLTAPGCMERIPLRIERQILRARFPQRKYGPRHHGPKPTPPLAQSLLSTLATLTYLYLPVLATQPTAAAPHPAVAGSKPLLLPRQAVATPADEDDGNNRLTRHHGHPLVLPLVAVLLPQVSHVSPTSIFRN